MTKPTVWASYEDDSGQRCVDIRKHGENAWSWAECRRDPEDATGWTELHAAAATFASEDAAFGDAMNAVNWLKPARAG